MSDDTLIRAKGVTKTFPGESGGERTILNALDFEIRKQTLTVVRGESGCGKSTLLRILGLIDSEFQGRLEVFGEVIGESQTLSATEVENLRSRHFAFIFQDDLLFPLLNLRENIELPARIHRLPDTKRRLDDLQEHIFRKNEIEDGVLERFRRNVSGGQRQRAALLRALSHGPSLILADEPTASLDPAVKEEVVHLFQELCDAGATILVASHDEIFLQAGNVYELSEGTLQRSTVSAPPVSGPSAERVPADGERPKFKNLTEIQGTTRKASRFGGCPPSLQIKIALREAVGNPLFTLMIVAAMASGLFQLTILWSLRSGIDQVLDDVINKGSRLDRIEVAAKPVLEELSEGGLPSDGIVQGVHARATVQRREIFLRVNDSRGRPRQETAFGLIANDPEVEKLELRSGQPFSNSNALAVLITERSVERFFGRDAVAESAIGKTLPIRFRRYTSSADSNDSNGGLVGAGEAEMEEIELRFDVNGVLARAESGRNIYLPQETLLAIATWQINTDTSLEKREGALRVDPSTARIADYERLHVYFESLDDVLPGAAYFERQGFTTKADLYQYRWVLDTKRFLNLTLGVIVAIVLGIAGLLVMSNVISGVRFKRKEIALLKLMGMKNQDVVSIFVLSVLVCALLGGILGWGAASVVVDGVGNHLTKVYPDSPLGRVVTPTWGLAGWALLLCVAVTLVFSIYPTLRIARKEAVWKLD